MTSYPSRISLTLVSALALASCSGAAAPHQAQSEKTAPAEPSLSATVPSVPSEALKAAGATGTTRTLYEKTGWHALWSPAATSALDHAIGSRVRNGLDHVDFGGVNASMSPAERDVARTRAALAYASALANGVVDPATLHDVYTIPKADIDVAAGLAQALQRNQVAQFFSDIAPQSDEYRRLSMAYVGLARQSPDHAATQIADEKTIHPGERDSRLPEIATQLAANDYLSADALPAASGGQATLYSPAVVAGIKALQADYGIKTDGVIGSATLAVINFGPADKAAALAVSLERRRWLARTPPPTRIDVNVAAATLDYYRDGKLVDHRRVIVGQPGRETPPLRAPLYRLVANPTWTVPKSIPVSAATIRAKHMHRERGYLVQPPGPDNALGLVKFDMKDDQQIYLHDTSNHSLFGRTQRELSHGCVRVQDALGFAKMIAQQEGVDQQWAEARQSGKQTFVALPTAIPVRLLYWNTFVDPKGEVAFRTDPYGWNDAVAKGLGFAGDASKKAVAKDIDLGP